MITRRRLALQITPMLDMLLIVMFLQFLDMKQRTASLEVQASASAASVQQMQDQLTQAQQDRDRVAEEQAAIARTLSEVFQLTPQETKMFLAEMRPTGPRGSSPAAQARLQQLASGSKEPILQHLLTYDEIRKRCDVWELFIDGQNVAHLDTGERERELRVNLNEAQDVELERFAVELEGIYRGLPQPKHLVILLLSYDREARLTVTTGVGKSLPAIVDRLNAAFNTVLKQPDVIKRAQELAIELVESTPESARKFYDDQMGFWDPVIKQSGARPE